MPLFRIGRGKPLIRPLLYATEPTERKASNWWGGSSLHFIHSSPTLLLSIWFESNLVVFVSSV